MSDGSKMKPARLLFYKSFNSRAETSGSSYLVEGVLCSLHFGAYSLTSGVATISAAVSLSTVGVWFNLLGFFVAYLLILFLF